MLVGVGSSHRRSFEIQSCDLFQERSPYPLRMFKGCLPRIERWIEQRRKPRAMSKVPAIFRPAGDRIEIYLVPTWFHLFCEALR